MVTMVDWVERARVVIDELSKYQGEKIVAHEHPIHKAVVRLEMVSVKMSHTKQPCRLPRGLMLAWYSLLDISRGESRVRQIYVLDEKQWFLDEDLPKEMLQRAKLLAQCLGVALESAIGVIELFVLSKGDLPYDDS